MMGGMATTGQSQMPATGPVGRTLIESLRELFEARGLSYNRASAALKAIGRPIPPLGLSRLVAGERRVDVDELVALAIVLGVNPSALLLPRHGRADDVVQLAPEVEQRLSVAWAWADGRLPLPAGMADAGAEELDTPADQAADFQKHARPDSAPWEVDPAFREAYNLAVRVHLATQDIGNPNTWDMRRDALIRAYRMVGIMLEELVSTGDREALRQGAFPFESDAAAQLRAASAGVRPPAVDYAPGTYERARAGQQAGPHGAATSRVTDPFGERDR